MNNSDKLKQIELKIEFIDYTLPDDESNRDYELLIAIKFVEQELPKNKELFDSFLDNIPYYFENYEDNIAALLKHFLMPELKHPLKTKLIDIMYMNRNFYESHSSQCFEILESLFFNIEIEQIQLNEYYEIIYTAEKEKIILESVLETTSQPKRKMKI